MPTIEQDHKRNTTAGFNVSCDAIGMFNILYLGLWDSLLSYCGRIIAKCATPTDDQDHKRNTTVWRPLFFSFFHLGMCLCHINAIDPKLIQTNTEPLEGVYILMPQAEYVNMRAPTRYLHRSVCRCVPFILSISYHIWVRNTILLLGVHINQPTSGISWF